MIEASQRLRLLYEISRELASFTDLDGLLRFTTRRTRELFGAEGCALLLLDRARKEFYFPVASQAESRGESDARLAEIRFPADRGVAGWVLAHDEPALVTDTSQDARFYDAVDRVTRMETRALICAPLRSRSGTIGVIEVVNPTAGSLTGDDIEFLQALASDIAVAHENAALYERMRGEAISLRKLCRIAGIAIMALALLIGAATTFTHLARALPVTDLASRQGTWTAALLLVAAIVLIRVGGGRVVPVASDARAR